MAASRARARAVRRAAPAEPADSVQTSRGRPAVRCRRPATGPVPPMPTRWAVRRPRHRLWA